MGQRNQENFCIHCGKPISSGDAFCVNCGAKITPQEEGAVTASSRDMICPVCGAEISSDDLFCTNCGSRLSDHSQHPVAPGRPKLKKPLLIACVGILLVTAVIGGYLWWNRGEGAVSADDDTGHNKSSIISPETKNPLPTNIDSADRQTPGDEAPTEEIALDQLYIGTWVPAGQTVGDEQNGWQALYLESVNENTLTFSLESVQPSPSSRIATTYPVTVTITDGEGTFPVNDSWGNSGTGTISLSDGAIHVEVSITTADPSAMWDIGMNTDFIPGNASADITDVSSGLYPSASNSSEGFQLSNLYVGEWEGEGTIIGDNIGGWLELTIESVSEDDHTITVTFGKVYPDGTGQNPYAWNVKIPINGGEGTFETRDSLGNSIEGILTVSDDGEEIYVKSVNTFPNSEWDLTMDTVFTPRRIYVETEDGPLALETSPYMRNNRIYIPVEQMFDLIGISVFQDGEITVAMTKSHALVLEPFGQSFNFYMDGEYDWEFSEMTHFEDGRHFVLLDTLTRFGLQFTWDGAAKTITLHQEVVEGDRVDAETVERLKNFTAEDAVQLVREAGHDPAPQGYVCEYTGGRKTWYIPFPTMAELQNAVVTYDGQDYQITEEDF